MLTTTCSPQQLIPAKASAEIDKSSSLLCWHRADRSSPVNLDRARARFGVPPLLAVPRSPRGPLSCGEFQGSRPLHPLLGQCRSAGPARRRVAGFPLLAPRQNARNESGEGESLVRGVRGPTITAECLRDQSGGQNIH